MKEGFAMVKLLVGHKGSGKTKQMIDMANDKVAAAKGSIIFINKNHRYNYELNHSLRVISTEDYDDLTNIDEYIGFVFGIISSDYDIETIFVDGILKHDDVALGDMPEFIGRLKGIADKYEIEIVVSLGAEKEELIGVDFEGCEIIN